MSNIKLLQLFLRAESKIMQQSFQDDFDLATGVGGKHLAPKRPLDYIVSFMTLMIISAVLASGGLLGLRLIDASVIFTGSVAESEQPSDPAVPQDALAIVDGTNTDLAIQIGEGLEALGWNVVSKVSLSEIDPSLPTSPTTLIFISDEGFRVSAEQLPDRFASAPIEVSDQFADPITILIGTDLTQ